MAASSAAERGGDAMTARRDGHTPKSYAQSCVITGDDFRTRIFFGTCGDGEMSLTQVIPQPANMAAMNKSLARSNNSPGSAKATK
jgi:hypothetical protein